MPIAHQEVYEFGRFRLDVGERRLACLDGAAPNSLPDKALRTLIHLVRNSGALVTHDELLAAVWPHSVVEKNNLGKAIHMVRSFLGDASSEPRFIETIAKHGYRFVAAVSKIAAREPLHELTTPDPQRLHWTRSPAYDLYCRGKVKAARENDTDTDEAIKLLEAAVALDPLFARAHAQLARAYNTRAFKFSSPAQGKLLQERADIALAKALDLEPELPEAHFVRGLVVWTKARGFPHEHAIKSFRRALAMEPDSDEVHHQLSVVLAHVGLLDEALEHVRTAVELNPNNTMARFRIGVYTAWQCRFEQALAILKTVPSDVSPMLVDRTRAEVLIQLGRDTEARAIVAGYLDRNPADDGGSLTSVNALLLARDGWPQEAERLIERAIEIGQGFGHFHHTAYNIASTYALLNRPDQAIDWLEAVVDDGFPCHACFARDPQLDSLRLQRRFVALMSTLLRKRGEFRKLV